MQTNQNNLLSTIQDDTLKTTALLYLKEALWSESYEDCKELIEEAKKFGAGQSEISGVLVDYFQAYLAGSTGSNTTNRLQTQGE